MPPRCFLVKLSPSSETLRFVKSHSKNIKDNILSQLEVRAFFFFFFPPSKYFWCIWLPESCMGDTAGAWEEEGEDIPEAETRDV